MITLPQQSVLNSALIPISNRRYRYVARDRSIDSLSTKKFRRQMRKLRFQLLKPNPASYIGCNFEPAKGIIRALGSDGNYYTFEPDDLELIAESIAVITSEVSEVAA